MSVFWIIVNCSKKWQCVCFVFCFVKSTFCVSLFVLQPGGDVTTHYLVWALFCNKNAQPLENWEFSKVHIFKPSPFTRVWTERAELCPSSIWTEDNKSLIIHIKLYFKWLQTAWLAEWETSAYSTNEWTSNVSEKRSQVFLSRGSFHLSRGRIRNVGEGCKTIEEKWMETLAEVRVPRCGDELVEAYYHCTVWWYNLSLSINPCLCPWFKFTICYKNVYCSKATFYWILFRGDYASEVQQHLACKWELPSCLIMITVIWL